ncbi:uncharacterized protein LOC132713376 [Ruditapes philippinarum]|uniref:uncharacterized protein LOC132713376 n=1 Tax=Ruditapes philippinarum TaxID=129788 RepID=UPI00295A6C54|nr:uncharacterized protein LOC132713376 [Ruditapes philippinarum]
MVYNLRSIGMSLIGNVGDSGCSARPDDGGIRNLKGSIDTASTSSLNNPTTNQSFHPANQDAAFISYPCQNTNQNHASDTYVSLMSSFEEDRSSKYKRRKQIKQDRIMESHNESVINLDSSLEVTILDISNNSTPSDSNSTINSITTETDSKLVCTILNCAAEFSSVSGLENHMELFKHSPCNPCLLTKDCRLADSPLCFMCPECDLEFSTRDECSEHINRRKHLTFFPPLAITAYMCPQCLHLFGSLEECWTHIEKQSHHGISYPFANDHALTTNKLGGPVAVAQELVQDIITKCNDVAYKVQCLECGISIETPAILKHHARETQNQHVVASLTETSLVDIFAKYLAGFSCNTCHRLFTGELKEMAKHQCARRVVGTIIENNTCSFAEFVKRCALTVIKSLELEEAAGPSRNLPPSPGYNARNIQHEAAAAETSSYYMRPNEASSKIESSADVDSNNEKGANGVNESRPRGRKGPRKTRWDVQIVDNSKGTGKENCLGSNLSDCNRENKENLEIKNAKGNKINNNEESYILIEDTDDGSDETDVDLPANSGAKRKRKTKNAITANKKCSSPDRKQNAGKKSIMASPFIVMNYKPRSPRLQGNILTQGYAVQTCETRSSPIESLAGSNKEALNKEKPVSPSRYKLRARSADKSAPSASQASDAGFENIAQRFLQEEVAQRSARSRHEMFIDGLSASKRDRSCSPVKSIDFGKYSNVLTQGHVGQPYLNPVKAIDEMNGIQTRPPCPPPMHGPTRYFLRNRCSFTSADHQLSSTFHRPNFFHTGHTTPVQYQLPHQSNQYFRPAVTSVSQQSTLKSSTYDPSQGCSTDSTSSAGTSVQAQVPARRSTEYLISTEHLSVMKNIVFLDLDNWPSFFHKLPFCLPDFTFVWGFYGGKNPWYAPMRLEIFRQMKQKEQFYLNERCGTTKDAADFAIVLAVGKMDEKLPANIAFTIMSGDKGFCEVERQMRNSERKVMVVNPHLAARFSNDMIYALVTSVTDT